MDYDSLILVMKQIGFTPSFAQWKVLLSPARFLMVTGGVRAGKSYLAALYLVLRILISFYNGSAKPGDLYWLVGPSYEATKPEFTYAKGMLAKLGFLGWASTNVNPGKIILAACPCGVAGCDHERIVIETKSATDFATLASVAPKGIVVCESGLLDIEAFWRVEERLAEARGWLYLGGVFEGSLGWYPEKFSLWQDQHVQKEENSQSFNIPSYTNLIIFPGGFDDPEIQRLKRNHSEQWFNERVKGIPAPPRGLVFPEFRNDIHVREVEFTEGFPVYIMVDPGYSRITESAYAVECFQLIEGQMRGFDEIYVQELTTAEVTHVLKDRSWYPFCDKYLAGDIASKQHQAAESHQEVWLAETGLWMATETVKINPGIDRMKTFLKVDPITKQTGIIFDHKMTGIISEFGGGLNPFTREAKTYQWRENGAGNVVGDVPADKYNHAIKATIYGLFNFWNYGEYDEDAMSNDREVTYR
jgi:hypothetical protein